MLRAKKCKSVGCNNPVWSNGLCKNHIPKKRIRSHKDKPQKDIGEIDKMREFFNSLWEKLPKVKKCRACGKRIFGENLTIYWDHLLEKEIFPQFKYEPKNMFFCCPDCHTEKSNGFPKPLHLQAIEKAKKELLDEFE
jgi:hypothetical protein